MPFKGRSPGMGPSRWNWLIKFRGCVKGTQPYLKISGCVLVRRPRPLDTLGISQEERPEWKAACQPGRRVYPPVQPSLRASEARTPCSSRSCEFLQNFFSSCWPAASVCFLLEVLNVWAPREFLSGVDRVGTGSNYKAPPVQVFSQRTEHLALT